MATVVPYSPSDYTMNGLGSVHRLAGIGEFHGVIDDAAAAALRARIEVQSSAALAALATMHTLAKVNVTLSTSSNRAARLANLARDATYISKLSGDYRRWSRAGKRDDGTAYSWDRWFDFAKDVAEDIMAQSTVDDTAWQAAGLAIMATIRDATVLAAKLTVKIGDILKSGAEAGLKTPWWVYALVAGGVGAVVAWPYVKPFVKGRKR